MNRKKRKQAHTKVPRGKRVVVVLKDGGRFVDKFIERKAHDVVFETRLTAIADIQSMTIYREIQRENQVSRATVKTALEEALGDSRLLDGVMTQLAQKKKRRKA